MRKLHHPARGDINLHSVLYALSDPTRLDLVRQAAAVPELAVKGCGSTVSKSTLSHHFSILRTAGITRTRTEGTQRFVSLRRKDLDARFPGLLDVLLSIQ